MSAIMHRNEGKRTARLEARLTRAVHALVQRAASLQGRSVSDFVVTAVRQAAEKTIEQHDLIALSRADQKRFAAALLKPAPVAPALNRAARAHLKLVESA